MDEAQEGKEFLQKMDTKQTRGAACTTGNRKDISQNDTFSGNVKKYESRQGERVKSPLKIGRQKVKETFMRHIQRLQAELEQKTVRICDEVSRSANLQAQLSRVEDELSSANRELYLLREHRGKLQSEIEKLKGRNLVSGASETATATATDGTSIDVESEEVRILRKTVVELETKAKEDIETIRELRNEMDAKIGAMRSDWAATLEMVERKQRNQSHTIEVLERTLSEEKQEHRSAAKAADVASEQVERMKSSMNENVEVIRKMRLLCEEKDRQLQQTTSRLKDSEDARKSLEKEVTQLKEERCDIVPPATPVTHRSGHDATSLEKSLRLSQKKVQSLKHSLRRRKEKYEQLKLQHDHMHESLEMWRRSDADNIAKRVNMYSEFDGSFDADIGDAELQVERVRVSDAFGRSFSHALQKLTVEAKREQQRLSRSAEKTRRRMKKSSGSKKNRRNPGGRVSRHKRGLSSSTEVPSPSHGALFFDDALLEDAFF